MEFVRHPRQVVGEAINQMKAGTYKFMNIPAHMNQDPPSMDPITYLDRFVHLRFEDEKIERYAMSSIILERSIDRALSKEASRPPFGLVTQTDTDQLAVVPEGGLQSANDLRKAMIATMKESVYEETSALDQLALENPTDPYALVWRQFQEFAKAYNSIKLPEGRVNAAEHLIEGGKLGISYMSFMSALVPYLFQEEEFQKAHLDLQLSPALFTKTLENSLTRNIPLPSGDGVSFDYLTATTVDWERGEFVLGTYHLEASPANPGDWVVVLNDEILAGRKQALKNAMGPGKRRGPHKDSLVLTCAVNHTELPEEEDTPPPPSTMDKMKDWSCSVASKMYERGYGLRR